jgi:hypothetical protein
MKLKNYTSSVSIERSISAIETLLVQAGAQYVSRFYNDKKQINGFLFQLPVNGIPVTFKLPSNPDAVKKVMRAEVLKPREGTLERIEEQAERTAWRVLHEWVHIQLTMIQMQQAEAVQVFLPYCYDPKNDVTLFQKMRENGFKQLTDGGAR